MDVPTHGEVDEHEDVELDEDGEAEKDGVHEEAGQAQPAVQSPLVQMDPEDLRTGETQSHKQTAISSTLVRCSPHVNSRQITECFKFFASNK